MAPAKTTSLPYLAPPPTLETLPHPASLQSKKLDKSNSQDPGKHTPPSSFLSKPYNTALRWSGFTKSSNFRLFILTAGSLSVYCLFRIQSLDYQYWLYVSESGSQQRFWFKDGFLGLAMKLHLWSVIPAAIFLPIQFIPSVRRNYPAFHRVSGRILLILLVIGNITAVVISKQSYGRTLTLQVGVPVLAGLISYSMYRAVTSIRNLHIDQHRAWILRTWAYAGSILTLRILLAPFIMVPAEIISPGQYRGVMSCEEIYSHYPDPASVGTLNSRYPACANFNSTHQSTYAIVTASLEASKPEEIYMAVSFAFGLSAWFAGVIHILAVEIYLNATKDEDERLKKISAVRRRAAGLEDAPDRTR